MKTKALLRTAILFATAFLLTSCIFDSLMKPEEQVIDNERIVTVTATMPNYSPSTRIGLKPDHGLNRLGVDFFWERGDKVDILVIGKDGDKEVARRLQKDIEVTIIDEHQAQFTFNLPEPLGNYKIIDVYGVYGGKGFSEEKGKEHMVVLPNAHASTSGQIDKIADQKGFVLTFAEKGIDTWKPPHINAQFEHLGSLFRIVLTNTGWRIVKKIIKAEFHAQSPQIIDVHRTGDKGEAVYDIIRERFEKTKIESNILTFTIGSTHLSYRESLEFWGWFIPGGHAWPRFTLTLYANEKDYSSAGHADAKTPNLGTAYHFAAEFDSDNNILTFPAHLP